MAANINVPTPDKIIQQTAIQSKVVATPFLFLAKRMLTNAKQKEKIAIRDSYKRQKDISADNRHWNSCRKNNNHAPEKRLTWKDVKFFTFL